jgi:YVTN family beta-propeller protein
MKTFITSLAVGAVLLVAGNCASAQEYHVLSTFHIPSNGGWDYIAVSPTTDNIYVSHATQVNILNKNTGDSVGVIPNTTGVHGIAFAPEFLKGFVSNGKLNTVTIFEMNINAVEGQVNVGENPDAIMYDQYSKKVWVCNGHDKSLSVIDPANNNIVKTIELDGKPETAVADAGHIYINIEDKNEIQVVNSATYTVEHTWKIGGGKSPSGLAIDVATKRLFAGCDNKLLIVVNAENGKVVKELPIGEGCDGVAFDAGKKLVFSSNGEGTLSMIKEISANKFEVMKPVPTKKGARTIAIDQKTHKVYLPTADFVPAPAAGQEAPKRRGTVPGTFQVLVVGE